MPDFTSAPHNSFDTHHRLARYLTHAAKTGVSPSACRDVLLALRVQAGHPHAAPFTLRMPHQRNTETAYVDTSRLPADHGRVDRTSALLSELQAAHRLLTLALGCMTPRQHAELAKKSQDAGLGTDGATRHHERAAVIAQATAGPA